MMQSEKNSQFEQREMREKFSDLIIFTTTYYGESEAQKLRSSLAEKLFTNAKNLNIKCVVVDGGSSSGFIEKISQLDNIHLQVDPSLKMGESRRKALEIAMDLTSQDPRVQFLWVEPEKEDLINEESLQAMITHLRDGDADIVVPSRINKDTYPRFQKWIEERANKRARNLFDQSKEDALFEAEIDLWFGPKMFNKDGAKFFLDYRGDLDKWDSIIKPVIQAQQAGKKIISVPVDFHYPEIQKEQEDSREFKAKRIEQYTKVLSELGDKHWKEKK